MGKMGRRWIGLKTALEMVRLHQWALEERKGGAGYGCARVRNRGKAFTP